MDCHLGKGEFASMKPMASLIVAIVLGSIVLCSRDTVLATEEPSGLASRQPRIPILKIEKYSLANGLIVILHQDHTTPVVSVNVRYKVGSKDEKAGRTGFAHLFEHMMFQGSQHHDQDYFLPLEKLGAEVNGGTTEDDTSYYETVPANALELALWLEADRMGFLLPSMTQDRLDNQRDVVKNERRQTVDNVPYGQAEEAALRGLYPPDHPYHHSVIGSMADLSAARLEDVAAFFRTHYVPNNALLCIAGDFEPVQARRWVERYFGPLPHGPEPVPARAPNVPHLDAPKHVVLTDAVSLPRTQLIWPTVPTKHRDEPALDVLAAILGELPKENRLFRTLMYDRQLAAQVGASHPTHLLTGTFEIDLYARPESGPQPGQQLAELIKLTDAEIERLQKDGPTAVEVRKAQNQRESGLIMGFQSVTHKASMLNTYLAVFGDPLGYRTELEKIFAVTPEDVKRVARQYLGPKRLQLDVLPGPPTPRPAEGAVDAARQAPLASPPVPHIDDDFDRSKMPPLGPTPRYTPPRFERRQLGCGLELRIVERHELPIVTFDLVVKSGETLAPKGKEGVASLTLNLLDEGTAARDALQLAGELAEIGSALAGAGALEASSVSLTTLARHLERALDLYADVILHPAFPEKELQRLKIQRLAHLKARADDPEQTALAVFPRLIYGLEHPYGRPDLGTPATVQSITRDDVAAFYKRIMVPGNAVLVVVGDVQPDHITAALESRFASLPAGPVPPPPFVLPPPSAAASRSRTLYLIDKSAAAQSVLTVGQVGVARKSPDFYAVTLMNAILGGQFASRINMKLREEKGYSYGAQSSYAFWKGPGPFEAGGTVQTAVTSDALVELFKELTDITGRRPVTDDELSFAKDRLIRGFPNRFETTFGVASQVAVLVADELPDDEFLHYQERIEAVTSAEVNRVARKYITPETMSVLVVGDASKIEKSLQSLPFVQGIQRLDTEGNSLPGSAAPKPAVVGAGAAPRSEPRPR
jgi:zinc protease